MVAPHTLEPTAAPAGPAPASGAAPANAAAPAGLIFAREYRVYFEDTDAGGIVYHANYLKFCERARTDFVREQLGIHQGTMLHESKQGFVITHLEAKFINSAHLDEMLSVSCIPVQVKFSRLEIYQEVKNTQGEVLFVMRCTLAFVDFNKSRPMAIPEQIRTYFQSCIPQDTREYLL